MTAVHWFHPHVHGPSIDYVAVAAAAAASWVGLPGPGDPVLIAAGVVASRHRLDITPVLLVAWAGAAAGGVAGWIIGRQAGRVVLTAPGPFRRAREKAVVKGDSIFQRFTVLAILLAPSWIAGIHRVRSRVYLPVNALSAALWAGGIGLAAYYVGPTVVDFVSDLGTFTLAGLVLLVIAALGGELLRRRGRRARTQSD